MDMQAPIVTAVLAGFLLVLQQALMMNVGLSRAASKTGVGHQNDKHLERLVRRHGNLAENAAIFLIVLALLEMLGGLRSAVVTLAAVFLVARLSHAFAFTSLFGSHEGPTDSGEGKTYLRARFIGALFTALSGFALGAYLLVIGIGFLTG